MTIRTPGAASDRPDSQWTRGTIFTVGHSTLPAEQFIALLKGYVEGTVITYPPEQTSLF